MDKRVKKPCVTFVLCSMLCGSFPVSAFADEISALPEVHQELYMNEESYTDDLRLISYVDLDELCEWNDEFGNFSKEQEAQLKKYVEENIIKGAATDYQKANLIFDWIYDNITYASDYTVTAWLDPMDVFTYKSAVCGGFSNLYKAMLNSVDIPSVLVAGNSLYGAHVWNAVYADDKWFYSDATWGTTSLGDFFDIGTKEFLNSHMATKVQGLTIETEEGVLIGYDNGVAVVGVADGSTTVEVPDMYRDMYVSSIAHDFFTGKYGVKSVHISPYIREIATQISSSTLEEFVVDPKNETYASKDGVLFSKDMKSLLVYPLGKTSDTFILPKETTSFDFKDTFSNSYLKNIEVEEGNDSYSSYRGALYTADKSELLMIPAGKKDIYVWENAIINDMALVNVNKDEITIYGTVGSPAQQFAQMYQIRFVDVSACQCETIVETITKATTQKDGKIVVSCKDCKEVKETKVIPAVEVIELSETEFTYDGTDKMPEVIVKDKTGKVLDASSYDVKYGEGCAQPGTYNVLVTLKGDYYSGTLTAEYVVKGIDNPFEDVFEKDYFYDAVLWAVQKKITTGESQTVFAPRVTCSRAQVVTFLWRERGCPEPKTTQNPFSDVPNGEYYYKAVLWAAEEGITTGVQTDKFAPKDTVTRGQFVTFLYRLLEKPDYAVQNPFDDVVKDTYYYDAVLWAYENGITTGTQKDKFSPEAGCIRCDVVTFLYRNR